MTPELDHGSVERAYAKWAPIYDTVFGTLFDTGRDESIAAAARIGGRILDVGVGTGISLTKYPPTACVIGIDNSEAMLRQAQRRMLSRRLTHIDALLLMDAEHLAFADATFDVSIAQYVITTVPKPEAVLDELARVTRPGGEILLVNHLAAETGTLRLVETRLAHVTKKLGWSLNFDWPRLLAWIRRHGGVQLLERRQIAPLGHFSFVRLKRHKNSELETSRGTR